MVIDATMPDETLSVLKSLKGKVLKSYECKMHIMPMWQPHVYSRFRLNMGKSSYDVCLEETNADGWEELGEWPTVFSAVQVDPKVRFSPGIADQRSATYLVDERITNVEVVRDHLEIFDAANVRDAGGDPAVSMDIDMGFALRTAYGVYTFSRDDWSSTMVYILKGDDLLLPCTIERHERTWTDIPEEGEGTDVGVVMRTIVSL